MEFATLSEKAKKDGHVLWKSPWDERFGEAWFPDHILKDVWQQFPNISHTYIETVIDAP